MFFKNLLKIAIKYYPDFLKGTLITLGLSLITVLFGTVLGSIFALGSISKNSILKKISRIYIEVIRGVPLLLQLWLFYTLGSASLGKQLSVILALIINSSAYVAEIIRSGIQAVSKGQFEASKALGLTNTQMYVKIIFPQAIKNILPALGNEFVAVIKETSLASVFFIGELITVKDAIAAHTFLTLEPYIIVGLIYLFLTYSISKLTQYFERRYA